MTCEAGGEALRINLDDDPAYRAHQHFNSSQAQASSSSPGSDEQRPEPPTMSDAVVRVVRALQAAGVATDQAVQVISPRKRSGADAANIASVWELNGVLGDVMNPQEHRFGGRGSSSSQAATSAPHSRHVLRTADRVVQIINNYDVDVYNGERLLHMCVRHLALYLLPVCVCSD